MIFITTETTRFVTKSAPHVVPISPATLGTSGQHRPLAHDRRRTEQIGPHTPGDPTSRIADRGESGPMHLR